MYYVSIYLSFYFSFFLSFYLSIYLSTYLSIDTFSLFLTFFLSFFRPFFLSFFLFCSVLFFSFFSLQLPRFVSFVLPIQLSIYRSIDLSIDGSIYIYTIWFLTLSYLYNLFSSHHISCISCNLIYPSVLLVHLLTHIPKKESCTKSLLELIICRWGHNDAFSAPNTSGKSIKSSWIPCFNGWEIPIDMQQT